MSCDICGGGACANWMHSESEQKDYEKVIEAFDKARALREEVREQIASEEADPTPYCSYGHRSKATCDCGPIAENE